MKKEQQSVIIVHSTNYALKAEKMVKLAGLSCALIPVPRHIASDCGVCLRVLRVEKEQAREILEQGCIEIDGVEDL
ncbi:MAG: DUF3343 domain-containing protein [Chitinivibrionales bacterium]|nr:DUF3343 domain-containing protein [Chitinivibrionales bacterium]